MRFAAFSCVSLFFFFFFCTKEKGNLTIGPLKLLCLTSLKQIQIGYLFNSSLVHGLITTCTDPICNSLHFLFRCCNFEWRNWIASCSCPIQGVFSAIYWITFQKIENVEDIVLSMSKITMVQMQYQSQPLKT